MMDMLNAAAKSRRFELRFQSLFHGGRGLSFPCDERGNVDLGSLSESLRSNYLFARTLIGRDFSMPAVVGRTLQ